MSKKKDRNRFLKLLPKVDLVFGAIEQNLDDFEAFFDVIKADWKRYVADNDLTEYLAHKLEDARQGRLIGFVGYENNLIVGVAWIENMQSRYGSIGIHTVDVEKYDAWMAVKLARSGYLDERIVELVHFHTDEVFVKTFKAMGFKDKFRRRMGLYFNEFPQIYPLPEQVRMEKMTLKHVDTIGKISFISHDERQDLEGYIDYSSVELCIAHKRRLLQGQFGKLVEQASLVIFYYDKPVGSCMVLDISCWGYQHMAWVFDIALLPEYQGYGLGEILMRYSIKGVAEAGYEMMGLAVTGTNEKAFHLYQKLGFRIYEEYFEILSEGALKYIGKFEEEKH